MWIKSYVDEWRLSPQRAGGPGWSAAEELAREGAELAICVNGVS
ncbi:MAG TPA: hypothetical protein VJX72_02065 [Candidatus Acidoferrum sp.]|nr:hypothetical protein [Candidatus Acidoferrum sp.]